VRSSRSRSSRVALEQSWAHVADAQQTSRARDERASYEPVVCNLVARLRVEGSSCPQIIVARELGPTRAILTPHPGLACGQAVSLPFRMGRNRGHSKLTLFGRVLRVWQGGVEIDLDAGMRNAA
jgi:hypothetical protein